MTKEDYIRAWKNPTENKNASCHFWDEKAKAMNADMSGEFEKEENSRITYLSHWLQENALLDKESDVLDICCGSGKTSIALGQLGRSVLGLDFSQAMLDLAEKRVAQSSLSNIQLQQADWLTIDIKAMNFERRFDLVFAALCPPLSWYASLQKMQAASRKYCGICGFVERKQELFDSLRKAYKLAEKENRWEKDFYYTFNILWLEGRYPDIRYTNMSWEADYQVDELERIYTKQLNLDAASTSREKNLVQHFLQERAVNGIVKERTQAKLAWLFWENA